MSCDGVNDFVTATVPAVNGVGPIADVSALTAKKTIYMSGPFQGEYVILGSHDDGIFVPVAQFEGQEARFGTSGPYTVKREIELTLKSIRIQRGANKAVNIVIAAQQVCPCN